MKTLRTLLFIAVADALLVLALLLLLAGYRWQAAALGVGTVAGVVLAAWLSRSKPAPAPVAPCGVAGCTLPHCICCGEHPDPVDVHASQAIRALTGQTAVLPEHRPPGTRQATTPTGGPMSTRTAVVITCDEPGCDAEYVGHGFEIASTARSAAGGDHWRPRRVQNGRSVRWLDICPDHRQDGDV